MNLALVGTVVNSPKLEMVREVLDLPHWKLALKAEYDFLIKMIHGIY